MSFFSISFVWIYEKCQRQHKHKIFKPTRWFQRGCWRLVMVCSASLKKMWVNYTRPGQKKWQTYKLSSSDKEHLKVMSLRDREKHICCLKVLKSSKNKPVKAIKANQHVASFMAIIHTARIHLCPIGLPVWSYPSRTVLTDIDRWGFSVIISVFSALVGLGRSCF